MPKHKIVSRRGNRSIFVAFQRHCVLCFRSYIFYNILLHIIYIIHMHVFYVSTRFSLETRVLAVTIYECIYLFYLFIFYCFPPFLICVPTWWFWQYNGLTWEGEGDKNRYKNRDQLKLYNKSMYIVGVYAVTTLYIAIGIIVDFIISL